MPEEHELTRRHTVVMKRNDRWKGDATGSKEEFKEIEHKNDSSLNKPMRESAFEKLGLASDTGLTEFKDSPEDKIAQNI